MRILQKVGPTWIRLSMQFIGLDKKYGRSVAPCVSSVPYGLLLVLFGSGGFGGCGGGVVVAEAMVAEKLQTLQRATCALPVLVNVNIPRGFTPNPTSTPPQPHLFAILSFVSFPMLVNVTIPPGLASNPTSTRPVCNPWLRFPVLMNVNILPHPTQHHLNPTCVPSLFCPC